MYKRKKIAPELNLLRGRMVEKKYTQKQLADEVGINPMTLSYILNGKADIKGEVIEKLVNILDIDPKDIHKFFFPSLCETQK